MRLWTLVLAVAFLLSACDAGHPDDPGMDNRWPGPELDVQVPGPGTTVKTRRHAEGDPSELSLYFRVRPMGEQGDLMVRYAIDDGPFEVHEDPTQAFKRKQPLEPGTRLLSAYLQRNDGTPRFGARATSVSTFIAQVLDETSGKTLGHEPGNPGTKQYGHTDDEGFWQPFDPNAPCLVVDARDGKIHVLAHRAVLDGKHYRVRYEGDAEGHIFGSDAESGRFGKTLDAGTFTIVLEEIVGDGAGQWQQVGGSRSKWTNAAP